MMKPPYSALCICRSCPSYVVTGETELLFCLQGKSQVLTIDKGCVCTDCPVTPKLGLRWKDDCFKGSGEERREQVRRRFSRLTLDVADNDPARCLSCGMVSAQHIDSPAANKVNWRPRLDGWGTARGRCPSGQAAAHVLILKPSAWRAAL